MSSMSLARATTALLRNSRHVSTRYLSAGERVRILVRTTSSSAGRSQSHSRHSYQRRSPFSTDKGGGEPVAAAAAKEAPAPAAAASASTPAAAATATAAQSAKSGGGGGKAGAGGGAGWWSSAEFWGAAGAVAGWGMSGAAIYDAFQNGPEMISLNMTGVLIVYSSLFARWAYVVKPQNMLLCACHVTNVVAQCNQMKRALEYKMENGEEEQVRDIAVKAAATAAGGAACVALGPAVQSRLVNANLGVISTVAAAPAGPFTVHFWAPMSKWLISGASFMDLHRPTDKISIAQYTALTLTGFFFSRYALLVTPINYTLCSVNIALFGSSAWHLGRKINADYISGPSEAKKEEGGEVVKA